MYLYEVKDVVREHFGRMTIPTGLLNVALTSARRTIEKEGNFWWMKDEKEFNCVANQQSYSIQLATNSGLELPNFKDARALHVKKTTDTSYEPVFLGSMTKDELDLLYETDSDGMPEAAVIENQTLYLYPRLPDTTYNLVLYFYQWTNMPTDGNIATDDLLSFFGEALIYGAVQWGYEIYLKDLQGAQYWKTQLGGNPFGRGGEIVKMKRENLKRDWRDQIMLTPRMGPGRLRFKATDSWQGYGRDR